MSSNTLGLRNWGPMSRICNVDGVSIVISIASAYIHTTTRTYLVELLRKVLKLRVKCQLIYIRSISGGWH